MFPPGDTYLGNSMPLFLQKTPVWNFTEAWFVRKQHPKIRQHVVASGNNSQEFYRNTFPCGNR